MSCADFHSLKTAAEQWNRLVWKDKNDEDTNRSPTKLIIPTITYSEAKIRPCFRTSLCTERVTSVAKSGDLVTKNICCMHNDRHPKDVLQNGLRDGIPRLPHIAMLFVKITTQDKLNSDALCKHVEFLPAKKYGSSQYWKYLRRWKVTSQ